MRRVKIAWACIGCAAALTGVVGQASAAKVLDLSTSEGLIAPGTQLNLGVGVFETPDGAIECAGPITVATLLNNSSAKDKVSIAAAAPTGTKGVVCSTSTPLGSVEVAAGGLPWTQQFASNGKALLKGHKKLALTVTLPLLGLHCSYEAGRVLETFPVAPTGVTAPLALSVSNQTFVRSASSALFCPSPVTANFAGVPVTIPGPAATLLPVYVTRRLVPKS